MKIIQAHKAPPGAIATCQKEMAQRDLFLAQASVHQPLENAWIALVDETVAGIAWSRTRSHGTDLDVRVLPRYRKFGIGSALFDAVTREQPYPFYAGCDAAQTSAIHFLEKRNFKLNGAVYAQRWDGAADDVPPAFQTAQLDDATDAGLVDRVLGEAYGDHWLQPSWDAIPDSEQLIKVAMRGHSAVGALVARITDRAVVICGLGVLASARRSGVGRMLLCSAMKEGASRGLGVAARVSADDEPTIAWTRTLGFWTYRTQIHFSAAYQQ